MTKERVTRVVHFHSSDGRFCGSKEQMRQFAMDPQLVTCRECLAKNTLAGNLSDAERASLDSLKAWVYKRTR